MGRGERTSVAPPRVGNSTGRGADVETANGELAPLPSARPVIWNDSLPTFDTVTSRESPVAPHATRPDGSAGSVPSARRDADTSAWPAVPVPVTGSGAGSGV